MSDLVGNPEDRFSCVAAFNFYHKQIFFARHIFAAVFFKIEQKYVLQFSCHLLNICLVLYCHVLLMLLLSKVVFEFLTLLTCVYASFEGKYVNFFKIN